jgi:hypothetical protein
LIAVAAYFRAEQRGFAPGNEMSDWLDAEADVGKMLGSGATRIGHFVSRSSCRLGVTPRIRSRRIWSAKNATAPSCLVQELEVAYPGHIGAARICGRAA